MWAGQESILSLDGGAFTLILWTVKLVLGDLAPAVIYGLVTVIHAERIAHPRFLYQATLAAETALPKTLCGRLRLFLENTFQELRDLGAVLVLGSAIAACIQVFVPRELILNLGQDSVSSILAMMLLAGVVSICSTVDSFFALSFAGSFTSGSLLAFLVYGPMIDLKAIGMLLSVFKPRTIFYLFILISQCTFLASLWINFHWN